MSISRSAASIVGAVLFSVSLLASFAGTTACTTAAKVGDKCEANIGACLDSSNRLICENGTYVASACKGPGGCKVADGKIACDIAGNTEADTCPKSVDGTGACSTDKKALVACVGGKFVVQQCGGPKACFDKGSAFGCDMTQAAVGDRCDGDDGACSKDRKSLLLCDNGKFAKKAECGGPKGCQVSPTGDVTCDRGEAAAKPPAE